MSITIHKKLADGRIVFKKSYYRGDIFFSLNEKELCELIELAKPEQELNTLLESLRPIVSAVEVNDSDTLCSLLTDDTIIWTAVGSWCAPSTITLGDLRNVRKHAIVKDDKAIYRSR